MHLKLVLPTVLISFVVFVTPQACNNRQYLPSSRVRLLSVPEIIDWRTHGVVSPVENQGERCHSSWAFSASGALEAHLSIKYNTRVTLSPKNLMDCSPFPNAGCNGGFVSVAFSHIISTGGVALKDSYAPYRPRTEICQYQSSMSGGTMRRFVTLPKDDERALAQAVYAYGPVAVSIHTTRSFWNYAGGIFSDENCSSEGTSPNHSVLVVGFGTDERGDDYWLLKNSLGLGWGEQGYMRLARNRNNMCGVASIGQYPIV